jgi:hypothetical protein
MKHFCLFDVATGRIRQFCRTTIDTDMELNVTATTGVAETDETDERLFYVLARVVTPRPACPVSATHSGLTINLTGVPLGAAITVTGAAIYSVTNDDASGAVALVFGAAGTYDVAVDCFPALDYAQEFVLP